MKTVKNISSCSLSRIENLRHIHSSSLTLQLPSYSHFMFKPLLIFCLNYIYMLSHFFISYFLHFSNSNFPSFHEQKIKAFFFFSRTEKKSLKCNYTDISMSAMLQCSNMHIKILNFVIHAIVKLYIFFIFLQSGMEFKRKKKKKILLSSSFSVVWETKLLGFIT